MWNLKEKDTDLPFSLLHRTSRESDLPIKKLLLPFFPILLLEAFATLADYRRGMLVTEVMVFSSPLYGKTGYYVCPRCSVTLEREFMSFCDRCGQRLDWKDYKKAKVIQPGQQNAHT